MYANADAKQIIRHATTVAESTGIKKATKRSVASIIYK